MSEFKRLTKFKDNNYWIDGKKLSENCGDFPCKDGYKCEKRKDRTCMYLQVIDRLAQFEDACEAADIKLSEIVNLKVHAECLEAKMLTAIEILKKIDWVGSGAKGLIEDAIELLTTTPK